MKQLLPCTQLKQPPSFPAAFQFHGFYSYFPTWCGGCKLREVREAAGGAAPVAQEDVEGRRAQHTRALASRRIVDRLLHPSLHPKIRPSPFQPLVTGLRSPVADATACSPQSQLRVLRISLASFAEALPHFLSDLQQRTCRDGQSGGLAFTQEEGGGTLAESAGDSASTDPEVVQPPGSAEGLRFPSPGDEVSQGGGKCDQLLLQSRYDALLRTPQAFGMQLQLLHERIQGAQEQQAKCVYMEKLLPLQQRIRSPGTDACLQVHPLVYAAFCMYNPSNIYLAAAMRVGAAEHFLGQYLKARSSKKAYRRRSFSDISGRGRAAAEQWLSHSSLRSICIYPLEALSPQLRLFPLTAPLRLAAWEDILSRALAD